MLSTILICHVPLATKHFTLLRGYYIKSFIRKVLLYFTSIETSASDLSLSHPLPLPLHHHHHHHLPQIYLPQPLPQFHHIIRFPILTTEILVQISLLRFYEAEYFHFYVLLSILPLCVDES